MNILNFKSKVLSNKKLTPTVCEIKLSVLKEFDFIPGSFVSLELEINDKKVRRSYSIASAPSNDKEITLCVKLVEDGLMSPKLFDLKEGDLIDMRGPYGLLSFSGDEKEIICIATGAGIAPFKSMIPAILEKGFDSNIKLLTGVRYEEEVLYEEEFKELEAKYSNFQRYSIVSRPKEKNYSEKIGRVQKLIEEYIEPGFSGSIFLCGISVMIDDVIKQLLDLGIKKEQIKFEKF